MRPGIHALLEGARRGSFEIVVAETLDRVSRDQADVAALCKHLKFAVVMIVTLAKGEISELHVGLKGTMNALFLKGLAAKTRRGPRGRVKAGKSGGGRSYDYDMVRRHDDAGVPIRANAGSTRRKRRPSGASSGSSRTGPARARLRSA
ncbi:MAG: recombinase family protein [bacterium]|nr:recombinase family protein [bacterium]